MTCVLEDDPTKDLPYMRIGSGVHPLIDDVYTAGTATASTYFNKFFTKKGKK